MEIRHTGIIFTFAQYLMMCILSLIIYISVGRRSGNIDLSTLVVMMCIAAVPVLNVCIAALMIYAFLNDKFGDISKCVIFKKSR